MLYLIVRKRDIQNIFEKSGLVFFLSFCAAMQKSETYIFFFYPVHNHVASARENRRYSKKKELHVC